MLCEVRDGVAVVTLNRPQAVNALNEPLRVGLRDTLQRLAAAPEVRAIVLTGAGRGFSAGADLREFTQDASQVDRQLAGQYHPTVRAIIDAPKPVIAAVEGFVSGIAGAYVLASDLVVMSEAAFLHLPFHTIALIPDGGLCWFVARALGHQRAFEMAVECQRMPAARCLELGSRQPRRAGRHRARRRARVGGTARRRPGDRDGGAEAHAARRADRQLDQSLELEVRLQRECIDQPDFAEGVRAFLEKRLAAFRRVSRPRRRPFPPGLAPA